MKTIRFCRIAVILSVVLIVNLATARADDPLPSWNDGATKKAIVEFVTKVTTEGGKDFVAPKDRIATFDNDGTLWCEQPVYVQVIFALERVKELAPQHPEWKEQEPFKSILEGHTAAALSSEKAAVELIMATHTGMSSDEFEKIVTEFFAKARHPKTHRLFTDMRYQPMVELLDYLRANKFQTFIVSGGGIEFMRPMTLQTYGIPPSQVVGSCGQLKFEMKDGKSFLMKEPKIDLVDDGPGKPVGIQRFIGQRPIMAFGNSDGDDEMLEFTTTGDGPRFAAFVHHTDAEREYAYDKDSHIGKLDKGLELAAKNGWTLIDMKNDWKTIFPPEKTDGQ